MLHKKITPLVARLILEMHGTADEVAERCGVSNQTVRLYKNLKTVKSRVAAKELKERGLEVVPLKGSARYRFTPEQVEKIRASDVSSTKVAAELGCSPSLIRMIRIWKAYNG